MKASAATTSVDRPEQSEIRTSRRWLSKFELGAKRAIDIAVALPALIILAPTLLVLALLIKLQDGGPVLFAQRRIGQGGRQFSCLKLRSMTIDAERALNDYLAHDADAAREWMLTQKLMRDPRITPLGQFMRKTSLDELPQLLNVLRGEMSLVGPRPIVPAERERYGSDLAYYLAMKPGITGLWQVSGRSECSYSQRVALDRAYAENWRLSDDIVILLKTIPAVLGQRGSC